MATLLTYEEWWAYEGKRRRERPYTPETEIRYKYVKVIDGHKKVVGGFIPGAYEKAYLSKQEYQYSFDNPSTLKDNPCA